MGKQNIQAKGSIINTSYLSLMLPNFKCKDPPYLPACLWYPNLGPVGKYSQKVPRLALEQGIGDSNKEVHQDQSAKIM